MDLEVCTCIYLSLLCTNLSSKLTNMRIQPDYIRTGPKLNHLPKLVTVFSDTDSHIKVPSVCFHFGQKRLLSFLMVSPFQMPPHHRYPGPISSRPPGTPYWTGSVVCTYLSSLPCFEHISAAHKLYTFT